MSENVQELLATARRLNQEEQFEGALAALKQAMSAGADGPNVRRLVGTLLSRLGRPAEALPHFDRWLKLEPENPVAHLGRGLALLLIGELREGFAEYEWRKKTPAGQKTLRSFDAPQWDGSDPAGKTILLHGEQGIGDSLQFVRYARLVAERGATVLLDVPPGLKPLMQTLPGISGVFEHGETLPPFDMQQALMSLPYCFATTLTTIPAEVPYLRADPELVRHWSQRLLPEGRRIGIVWFANPQFPGNARRSTPLSRLSALLDVPGITWISLQKGDAAAQLTGTRVHDFGSQLQSWSDTAAILEQLDLVVSVDTGVAHLAGALARPVWVMLGDQPDFRWMLHRSDSPWYPTMRLFRQPKPGDWVSVAREVASELKRLS